MDKALTFEVHHRAQERCEYCRMPQAAYRSRFQIDHIIAQQHNGPTQSDNLALCCIRCNCHKGPNVAGVDPLTGQITRLFHPRRDDWNDHFSWNGPTLVGRTPEGRTTIDVLAINDPDYVALRAALMEDGSF
jgi:HNH endonuclease